MYEILLGQLKKRIEEQEEFLKKGGLRTDNPDYGEGYDSAVQSEIDVLKEIINFVP